MNQIRVKLSIIMILTIVVIGCATSSISDRSVTHSSSRSTTRRTRHHRSSRSSNNNSGDSSYLEREFNKNAFLVKTHWKCQTPKPRLVYLNEALHGEPVILPHMEWFVNAAVLYRCENALGCCKYPQVCSPDASTNVTITFKAEDKSSGTFSYPQLQFSNHTSCSCQTPNT